MPHVMTSYDVRTAINSRRGRGCVRDLRDIILPGRRFEEAKKYFFACGKQWPDRWWLPHHVTSCDVTKSQQSTAGMGGWVAGVWCGCRVMSCKSQKTEEKSITIGGAGVRQMCSSQLVVVLSSSVVCDRRMGLVICHWN